MAFTQEQAKAVMDALSPRTRGRPCPLCGGTAGWSVNDAGLVMLGLQDQAGVVNIGGPAMPCVALTCNNCGDTHLLNVLSLGVGRAFGLSAGGA